MRQIAARLADLGWTLRSGGADGADTAFEEGCESAGGQKEIFLPWAGFKARRDGIVLGNNAVARSLAERFHPAWGALPETARKLHARNVGQILGQHLDTQHLSQFVVAWTPGGLGGGGTGQTIRMAVAYGVPVFDLFNPDAVEQLASRLQSFLGPD